MQTPMITFIAYQIESMPIRRRDPFARARRHRKSGDVNSFIGNPAHEMCDADQRDHSKILFVPRVLRNITHRARHKSYDEPSPQRPHDPRRREPSPTRRDHTARRQNDQYQRDQIRFHRNARITTGITINAANPTTAIQTTGFTSRNHDRRRMNSRTLLQRSHQTAAVSPPLTKSSRTVSRQPHVAHSIWKCFITKQPSSSAIAAIDVPECLLLIRSGFHTPPTCARSAFPPVPASSARTQPICDTRSDASPIRAPLPPSLPKM